jgi:hypothetical protein
MHAGAAAATVLSIVVSPGNGGAAKHWTLTCGPAGGTLPRHAQACTRRGRLDAPFAPVAKGTACSQVFGGPRTAQIVGTYRGRRSRAVFTRQDGCEIARWNRLAFLFPGMAS